MIEIFDQIDKNRKQVFKKPQEDRPCEYLRELEMSLKFHYEQHEKTKRRWKTIGMITGISVVVISFMVLCSYLIAMFMTRVTP